MPTERKSCRVSQWISILVSLTTLWLHTWLDFQECYLHWDILSPPHPSRWLMMSWTNQVSQIFEMWDCFHESVSKSGWNGNNKIYGCEPAIFYQTNIEFRKLVCKARQRRMQADQNKYRWKKWERERQENQTCWLIDLVVPLHKVYLLSYIWF